MSRPFARAVWASLLLAVTAATVVPPARVGACALVGPSLPRIDGEEALIVFHADTGIEDFVRTATFAGVNAPIGFLVPTPSRPTLAEADSQVFDRLFAIYERPPPRSLAHARSLRGEDGVTVVERRTVAGLDAAVLRADDADALAAWLREHGFPSRPAIASWLAPYVATHAYVTAFRYVASSGERKMTSRAIRMSFATRTPFFPYSEPADARGSTGRPFRVSVIAPYRVDARLGTRPWRVPAAFADVLEGPGRDVAALLYGSTSGPMPASSWITTFDDRRSVRGADDLTFVRAVTNEPVVSRIDRPIAANPPTRSRSTDQVLDPFAF